MRNPAQTEKARQTLSEIEIFCHRYWSGKPDKRPSKNGIGILVNTLLDQLSLGSSELARLIEADPGTVRRWAEAKSVPRLAHVRTLQDSLAKLFQNNDENKRGLEGSLLDVVLSEEDLEYLRSLVQLIGKPIPLSDALHLLRLKRDE
jgi:hypothetical protein